jgi:hypothetical protein
VGGMYAKTPYMLVRAWPATDSTFTQGGRGGSTPCIKIRLTE